MGEKTQGKKNGDELQLVKKVREGGSCPEGGKNQAPPRYVCKIVQKK